MSVPKGRVKAPLVTWPDVFQIHACATLRPCVNGAECREVTFTYTCLCPRGFAGKRSCVTLGPFVLQFVRPSVCLSACLSRCVFLTVSVPSYIPPLLWIMLLLHWLLRLCLWPLCSRCGQSWCSLERKHFVWLVICEECFSFVSLLNTLLRLKLCSSVFRLKSERGLSFDLVASIWVKPSKDRSSSGYDCSFTRAGVH